MTLELTTIAESANARSELLREAWGDVVDPWQLADPTGWQNGGAGVAMQPQSLTYRADRFDGRYMPFYWQEMDLRSMRAASRNVCLVSEIGQGAYNRLANYTFGKGFQFDVECESPQLKAAVEKFIAAFCDKNEFVGSLDREINQRSREDGECLVTLSKDPNDGVPTCGIEEPDSITEPANKDGLTRWIDANIHPVDCELSWSFGVATPKGRTDLPLGYHLVRDDTGRDWSYIPARNAEFFKRNCIRNAKRGVSDMIVAAHSLYREAKLRRNVGEGSALQAAIAWIEEFAPSAVASGNGISGGGSWTATVPTQNGPQSLPVAVVRPGTIVRTGQQKQYKPGPAGSERNAAFIAAGGYLMRAVATIWDMPENMISGDASNANYSSLFVAQSPFVKAREADQLWFGKGFTNVIWKALRLAYESGVFLRVDDAGSWQAFKRAVTITIPYPNVEAQDKGQQTSNAIQKLQAGITDIEGARAELGILPDETEDKNPLAQIALNGAQMATLQQIVQAVASGLLPGESAVQLISLSIPSITPVQAMRVVQPATTFTPRPQPGEGPASPNPNDPNAAASGTPPAEWSGVGRRQLQNNDKAVSDVKGQYLSGAISRAEAEAKLGSIGLSDVSIERYLEAWDTPDGADDAAAEAAESDDDPAVESVAVTEANPQGCNQYKKGCAGYKPKKPPATLKSKGASDTDTSPDYAQERESVKAMFGDEWKPTDALALTGAENDGDAHIETGYGGSLTLKVWGENDSYFMKRNIRKTANGDIVCENDFFETKPPPNGAGLRMFSDQVDRMSDAGVSRIETHAARHSSSKTPDNKFVGYKVWPKFGYDGVLEPKHTDNLPAKFQGIGTIQELYATPGGREAWEKFGTNINLTFDLSDGSRSRQILDAYKAKKAGK